jgi:hypothetical protein
MPNNADVFIAELDANASEKGTTHPEPALFMEKGSPHLKGHG